MLKLKRHLLWEKRSAANCALNSELFPCPSQPSKVQNKLPKTPSFHFISFLLNINKISQAYSKCMQSAFSCSVYEKQSRDNPSQLLLLLTLNTQYMRLPKE